MRAAVGKCFTLLAAAALLLGAAVPSRATVTLSGLVPEENVRSRSAPLVRIEYDARNEGLAVQTMSLVDAARRRIARLTGDAFAVEVLILLAPTAADFSRLAGPIAEHSSAVALPGRQTMIVSAPVMQSDSLRSLSSVLAHEMMHLYVGVRFPTGIPLWLNEGLAVIAGGEVRGADQLMILQALNRLPRLEELNHRFPQDPQRRQVAYAYSAAVTQYLIDEDYGGSMPALMAALTGPEGGGLLQRMWDATEQQMLEYRYRNRQDTWGNYLLIPLQSWFFWGAIVAVLVAAYIARKRRAKRLHEEWADDPLADGDLPPDPNEWEPEPPPDLEDENRWSRWNDRP